jgi:hypothetical protein
MRKRRPRPRGVLTAVQARALLHKYRTGDFPPGCRWTTIRALIRTGLVVLESHHALVVTAQGEAYCTAHDRDICSPRPA